MPREARRMPPGLADPRDPRQYSIATQPCMLALPPNARHHLRKRPQALTVKWMAWFGIRVDGSISDAALLPHLGERKAPVLLGPFG